MDKKQEIRDKEIAINQNQIETGLLKAEGDHLQAELEALKEPELKHGDYGLDFGGLPRLSLKSTDSKMFSAGIRCCMPDEGDDIHPSVRFGNIFADIAMLREPLEEDEFKVDGKRFAIEKGFLVYGECGKGWSRIIATEHLLTLSNNLRRMLAELKRQEAKGKKNE